MDSIIRYLGHAPIVFNEHIFTLPDFAFGNYSLGALFKTTFTEASVGGNWDTLFFTFVGWFWIDWSFIGTIIISIIVFSTMNFIIRKKRYDLSDLFLIVTYFQFLTSGVFVIGRQYIYTLISNLIIYALLKLICSFDFAKQPNFVYSNNTDLL